MTETDRDPRPDLAEDHFAWVNVLITAHQIDPYRRTAKSVFGLLHGLRCEGARLQKLENGRPKLDYEPLLKENGGRFERTVLLEKWLEPVKKEIGTVFRRAAGA